MLSLNAMSALKKQSKVCLGIRVRCDRGSRPKRIANNCGWTLLYFLTQPIYGLGTRRLVRIPVGHRHKLTLATLQKRSSTVTVKAETKKHRLPIYFYIHHLPSLLLLRSLLLLLLLLVVIEAKGQKKGNQSIYVCYCWVHADNLRYKYLRSYLDTTMPHSFLLENLSIYYYFPLSLTRSSTLACLILANLFLLYSLIYLPPHPSPNQTSFSSRSSMHGLSSAAFPELEFIQPGSKRRITNQL